VKNRTCDFIQRHNDDEEEAMADTLVATVDGPLGKAEIYEVTNTLPNGPLAVEYEVRSGTEVQKYAALGAAYIAAGELTGSKT
jgi:hypothetical protein